MNSAWHHHRRDLLRLLATAPAAAALPWSAARAQQASPRQGGTATIATIGEPPSGEAIRAAAGDLGVGPNDTLAVLAREDLVHVDDSGRPTVPTRSRRTTAGTAC